MSSTTVNSIALPTILIVDDDPTLRKAIAFDFKRKGYRVLEAENGKLAYDIVKKEPVRVVLTDVRMPGGDGVELLERIRANADLDPAVIFVTGFAEMTIEDAYDMGANAVVTKPFNRKALFRTVERSLLPPEKAWADQVESSVSPVPVKLSLPNISTAIEGHALNIGRGGMFVAVENPVQALDEVLDFEIRMSGDPLPSISGRGVVRWIRFEKRDDLVPGLGIEFVFVNQADRDQLISFIKCKNYRAYIPRG